MAKMTITRRDIADVAERLEGRGTSKLFDDMPSAQADMRTAARLLREFIDQGYAPASIEIENGGQQ